MRLPCAGENSRTLVAVVTAGMLALAVPLAQALAEGSSAEATVSTGVVSPQKPNLESIHAGEATGILGKEVVALDGSDLGPIIDVIVDSNGRPRAAVIDFGGFLGVGSRKVAVDWDLLKFDTEKPGRATLALGRREIQAAPEYRANGQTAEIVGPPLFGTSGAGDGAR